MFIRTWRPGRVGVGNKSVDYFSSPERSVSVSSSSEELNSSWQHVFHVHLNFSFKYEKMSLNEGPRVTDNRCNVV